MVVRAKGQLDCGAGSQSFGCPMALHQHWARRASKGDLVPENSLLVGLVIG